MHMSYVGRTRSLGQSNADGLGRMRRLSDKILVAFHQACDGGRLTLAAELLRCCEAAMRDEVPAGGDRRRSDEILIAAFERLWFLQHPGTEDDWMTGHAELDDLQAAAGHVPERKTPPLVR
jgi:hypothetical protein